MIRVDADEVTYPAHVILRYRLERAMIAGDLVPADLPGAWAEGLRGLLGIVPADDREGCLQDIHWYDGVWGYFPTYTLGALIAAQLFEAARAAIPDVLEAIAAGEFALVAGLAARAGSFERLAAVDRGTRRGRDRPAARDGEFRASLAQSLSRLAQPPGSGSVNGDKATGLGDKVFDSAEQLQASESDRYAALRTVRRRTDARAKR